MPSPSTVQGAHTFSNEYMGSMPGKAASMSVTSVSQFYFPRCDADFPRVTSINRRKNGVKVTVENETSFFADAAVIAMPLGVLKKGAKEMEMNLTQLCDLDPMIDDSKILVHCISIIEVSSLRKSESGVEFRCRIARSTDVIGTVVSVLDAIPFNNYGKDQLRRTIILEDVHIIQKKKVFDRNDMQKGRSQRERKVKGTGHRECTHQTPKNRVDKESTKGRSTIKAPEKGQKIIQLQYILQFKVVRFDVMDDTGSASLLLFDDLVFNLTNGEQCHKLIQEHGPNYDDYFPPELNVLVGKRVLWPFQYTNDHIENNNFLYQVKLLSVDEAMLTSFQKGFHLRDTLLLEAPLLDTAKSSRFSNVANIPFNLEDSPQTADGTTEGNGTNTNGEGCSKETENDGGDSGSGKRTIIDLDDYYEKPAVAKRNKVIQVKLEPKD
ncbi:replication protein A 70 kDa DNA-binding subunit B [Tanacetum coccineum]|uniref:Replication protein A 70 kDa DNA-binding subunit B n=1 Tax=Tanacetum coccineum TaxID=301880 RepID=A0ABQ5AK64_9ASTR